MLVTYSNWISVTIFFPPSTKDLFWCELFRLNITYFLMFLESKLNHIYSFIHIDLLGNVKSTSRQWVSSHFFSNQYFPWWSNNRLPLIFNAFFLQAFKETLGTLCTQWKSTLGQSRGIRFLGQIIALWPPRETYSQRSNGASILL